MGMARGVGVLMELVSPIGGVVIRIPPPIVICGVFTVKMLWIGGVDMIRLFSVQSPRVPVDGGFAVV